MSPRSNSQKVIDEISAEYLGVSMVTEPDDEVTLTKADLDKALKAAYEQGVSGRSQGGIDPSLDSSMLFWQLLESLPDHVWFKNLDSQFICVNQALSTFFGLESPEHAIGKTDRDFFREEFADLKLEAEREIIRTGKGWSFLEEKGEQHDGTITWQLTSKLPLYDAEGTICGTFGISRDTTDSKMAELALDRQRQLLETIVEILPCRIFVRDTEGRFILINEEYRKRFGLESRDEVVGKRLSDFRNSLNATLIAEQDRAIIKSGKPVLRELEYNKSLLGDRSWVLISKVPLRSSAGEIEGIVGVTLDITEQKDAEAALQGKNEQFEAELLVARHLQEQMMAMGFDDQPLYLKNGLEWNLEASYYYRPSHHLAGDFFYILPISKNRLGILICDVMGHGVKAALVTMLLRGLMLEDTDLLIQPEKLLEHLNNNLVRLAEDDDFPRFVTAAYCVVNLRNGNVSMANAGHPVPLWRVPTDEGPRYEPCPATEVGPALGLIDDESYESSDFKLTGHTEMYFFTDGLIEETMKSGEDFGLQGLGDAILRHDGEDLPELLNSVVGDLQNDASSESLSDDVCMIAVRIQKNQ